MSAKEKQAAPKATFVFLAPLTSKHPAKQGEKRRSRGLASLYEKMLAKENQAAPKATFVFVGIRMINRKDKCKSKWKQ